MLSQRRGLRLKLSRLWWKACHQLLTVIYQYKQQRNRLILNLVIIISCSQWSFNLPDPWAEEEIHEPLSRPARLSEAFCLVRLHKQGFKGLVDGWFSLDPRLWRVLSRQKVVPVSETWLMWFGNILICFQLLCSSGCRWEFLQAWLHEQKKEILQLAYILQQVSHQSEDNLQLPGAALSEEHDLDKHDQDKLGHRHPSHPCAARPDRFRCRKRWWRGPTNVARALFCRERRCT